MAAMDVNGADKKFLMQDMICKRQGEREKMRRRV